MDTFKKMLDEAWRVTVLTGAGVSTASGIPDFKSLDNTWPYPEPRERMISRSYFHRNPKLFWECYRDVFGEKLKAEPNSVHRWISELGERKLVRVLTQNVDRLHQAAGSEEVLELHGNAAEAVCTRCGARYAMAELQDEATPRCRVCRKMLKPATVLFGEPVKAMEDAERVLRTTDVLLVLGTSLDVYPVASLPTYAKENAGAKLVWVSNTPAPEGFDFDLTFEEDLTNFVDRY